MNLYIIRHAWAEEADEQQWPDDFGRPLTREGQKRFAKVVELLATRGFSPQTVVTSPLVRCRQTADVVARQFSEQGRPLRLVEHDALVPGSDLASVLTWTEAYASDCDEIAWVGHAPDVSLMTATLIGAPQGWIRFAKGAIAAIQFDDTPEPGGGELRWLATAKLLGC